MVCSGCRLLVDTNVKVHKCIFSKKGFNLNLVSFRPCQVMYHAQCIRVGPPFRSRHFGKGTLGLQFPPCATDLPFICELCTVRTHLGREIDPLLPIQFRLNPRDDKMIPFARCLIQRNPHHSQPGMATKGPCQANTVVRLDEKHPHMIFQTSKVLISCTPENCSPMLPDTPCTLPSNKFPIHSEKSELRCNQSSAHS